MLHVVDFSSIGGGGVRTYSKNKLELLENNAKIFCDLELRKTHTQSPQFSRKWIFLIPIILSLNFKNDIIYLPTHMFSLENKVAATTCHYNH